MFFTFNFSTLTLFIKILFLIYETLLLLLNYEIFFINNKNQFWIIKIY